MGLMTQCILFRSITDTNNLNSTSAVWTSVDPARVLAKLQLLGVNKK